MSATIETARDDITKMFLDAWEADAISQNLPVIYWDLPNEIPSEDSGDSPPAWARLTIQHTWGSQATLSGDTGKRRWLRRGMATVQIFTPTGDGLSLSDKLTMVAMRAFEGRSTASGIWFRYVRADEVGPDGVWFQTNVLASFEYDEVR